MVSWNGTGERGIDPMKYTRIDALEDIALQVEQMIDEIGLNGHGPDDHQKYYCEFCHESAPHWRNIPHEINCRVNKLKLLLVNLINLPVKD